MSLSWRSSRGKSNSVWPISEPFTSSHPKHTQMQTQFFDTLPKTILTSWTGYHIDIIGFDSDFSHHSKLNSTHHLTHKNFSKEEPPLYWGLLLQVIPHFSLLLNFLPSPNGCLSGKTLNLDPQISGVYKMHTFTDLWGNGQPERQKLS